MRLIHLYWNTSYSSKLHKTEFVTEFLINYRRCADPKKSQENVAKTSLHETFLEEFRNKNKVFLEKEDNKTVEIGNEIPNENEVMKTDEISQGAAKDVTNQSLEMLECSSLKMS